MVSDSGPHYPGSVIKGFADADVTVVAQDDIATDATGTVIAGAVNNILSVLRDLNLVEAE